MATWPIHHTKYSDNQTCLKVAAHYYTLLPEKIFPEKHTGHKAVVSTNQLYPWYFCRNLVKMEHDQSHFRSHLTLHSRFKLRWSEGHVSVSHNVYSHFRSGFLTSGRMLHQTPLTLHICPADVMLHIMVYAQWLRYLAKMIFALLKWLNK